MTCTDVVEGTTAVEDVPLKVGDDTAQPGPDAVVEGLRGQVVLTVVTRATLVAVVAEAPCGALRLAPPREAPRRVGVSEDGPEGPIATDTPRREAGTDDVLHGARRRPGPGEGTLVAAETTWKGPVTPAVDTPGTAPRWPPTSRGIRDTSPTAHRPRVTRHGHGPSDALPPPTDGPTHCQDPTSLPPRRKGPRPEIETLVP